MLVHWIWLATRPFSDRTKAALLRHFSDPEEIYYADALALEQVEDLKQEHREALAEKDLNRSEWILRQCGREGISILTYRDAQYPARLKNIPDPPCVLYYKGRLPDFDGLPLIGVVGTRKASAYGLTAAKRLGYQIARCGGIVVSGMAHGIDSLAMSGALTAGREEIGVLGCGADMVYPPSNKSLFADTQRYGCILTEFPPGTPPVGRNFPRRNRIISGLSCGVLVVEAPEKSGALITARQALDQGRDVFVVPGNIDVDSFVGSNRLLRDGAIAVSSGWDVMSEYEGMFPDKIRKDEKKLTMTAYADEVALVAETEREEPKVAQKPAIPKKKPRPKQKTDKKVIDNGSKPPYSDVNTDLASLSPEERAIADTLMQGEKLVDDVIAETGLSTAKVLAHLTILEIRGIIQRLPGKRVRLR